MKELNYTLTNKDLDVNLYIEQGSKSSNCWWSKLPSLFTGHKSLYDYFTETAKGIFSRKLPAETFEQDGIPTSIKICPAVGRGILDKTFLIKTPCDIMFSINTNGEILGKTPDNRLLQVASHPVQQFWTETDNPFEGYINVKWLLPIRINSNKVPYIFLQPQYHKQDYPFQVMNGVVEGHHTLSQELNIQTLIKVPSEPQTYFIKAGTVLCYLWSPEKLKLVESDIRPLQQVKFIGKDRYIP